MQIFSEQARAFPSVLKRRGVAHQNGFRRGKQSYRCQNCGCQYVENPKPKGYLPEVKQLCQKMYLNGMGFRAQGVRAQVASSDAFDASHRALGLQKLTTQLL